MGTVSHRVVVIVTMSVNVLNFVGPKELVKRSTGVSAVGTCCRVTTWFATLSCR